MNILVGNFREKFSRNDRENGSSLPLVIGLVLALLLAAGLGYWGYTNMNQATQYKQNADAQAAAAAAAATKSTTKSVTDKLNAQFQQQYKQPFTRFTSPSVFGTVSFQYPKTWSQFVYSNQNQFQAYFYPIAVPPTQNQSQPFALRVNILPQPYSQILQQYQGQVQNGALTTHTLNTGINGAAKGVILQGQFSQNINGYGAIFPVLNGNYTLEMFTDKSDFYADFNNTILPSLSYQL